MPVRIPRTAIRTTGLLIVGSTLGYSVYRWHTSTSQDSSLNPTTFTTYTLVAKQPVSSTSSIFTLRSAPTGAGSGPKNNGVIEELTKRGCVWSVQVKQPLLQIARSYTPLPPPQSDDADYKHNDSDIRLLIRREEKGEVSGYLHSLPLQSTLELRGPHVELELPSDVREVLFLAGGTGIAPAMQVADILSKRQGVNCHILWANRRREDCVGGDRGESNVDQGFFSRWRSLFGVESNVATPPSEMNDNDKGTIVRELEALKKKSQARLGIDYFVDEEQRFIRPSDVLDRVRQSVQARHTTGQKIILVSGPDGFIEYWAGKKVWVAGHEEQGPLGGAFGKMELKDWKVWKL